MYCRLQNRLRLPCDGEQSRKRAKPILQVSVTLFVQSILFKIQEQFNRRFSQITLPQVSRMGEVVKVRSRDEDLCIIGPHLHRI
jgi:hypothetical protein